MRRFISMPFIGLGLLGLLGMTVALPSLNTEKVHLQMEEDELRQIFQTEPHAIPDYEVVSLQTPRFQEKGSNSGTRIRLNAFGKNIQLWLNPIEGILASYDTPVYIARSSRKTVTGVIFNKIDELMDVVGNMLEDREKEATLIVRRNEDGKSSISGTVGSEGWVVRPLPTRFSDLVNARERRSVDLSNSTIDENEESHAHVIFKNPKLSDEARYTNKPIRNNVFGNKTSRLRRSIHADIIYPEILVVADHETYRRHGQNIYHVLEYLLPFWNGVDLRYRTLEYPKVRLNIAGIVIAMDGNALSYMETHKIDTNALIVQKALFDFGKFLPKVQSTFPFPSSYDIAVTMSPYDMCWVNKNGARECGVLAMRK